MTALVDIVAFKVAQYTIKTYFCENDEKILWAKRRWAKCLLLLKMFYFEQ